MNKPADLKLATVPAWINGKPVVPAGRMGEVYNPATGQVTKRVPYCDAAAIDAAVKAASAALPEWRDASILRRARVMQKYLALLQANQKDIARLITEEHGKTLPDAMGSVQRGIEVVEFACGIPQLLKGEYSENVGTRSTRIRCASRWGCARASRRSTSPRWCRCGCSRWRSPAATRSY
jgi:malonate-semialdehyde dehydrogenase (acetylating) / methylmalonate-semialdehyde dehydrogenase